MKLSRRRVLITSSVLAILIILFLYGWRRYTRSWSPKNSRKYTKKDFKIEVFYNQPSKRDREIFGNLVPFGKVWRTGANEATELEFNQDINFGDKPLKAGRYTLFTIPHKKVWTIILNQKLGQWGAFKYRAEDDVLRTKIPSELKNETTETFTIDFIEKKENILMRLHWDKTNVDIPIEIKQ